MYITKMPLLSRHFLWARETKVGSFGIARFLLYYRWQKRKICPPRRDGMSLHWDDQHPRLGCSSHTSRAHTAKFHPEESELCWDFFYFRLVATDLRVPESFEKAQGALPVCGMDCIFWFPLMVGASFQYFKLSLPSLLSWQDYRLGGGDWSWLTSLLSGGFSALFAGGLC